MVLFWIWILTGGPRRANPDRLDDRAFAASSEERCQQLLEDLDDLPSAATIEGATDRATVLDRATDLVEAMIDDLESGAPRSGDDDLRLTGWFSDWRTYIGDRRAYAEALRADSGARFQVTENAELRDGVDKTIEIFADVNDMPSCATPGDVG